MKNRNKVQSMVTKPYHPIIHFISLLTLIGFLLLSLIWFQTPVPSEQPGDPLELRGSHYMAIRTPKGTPLEHIFIDEDNWAYRIAIPYNNARDTSTQLALSPTDNAELQKLRTFWCQGKLVFSSHESDLFYDVAIMCNNHEKKQQRVPVAELPLILRNILQRIPDLPHKP